MFVATEDWYFASDALQIAAAAKDHGFRVTVATRVQAHASMIAARGIRVVPIDTDRSSRNPAFEIFRLAKLIWLYLRERPDIVHHIAVKPVLYGTVAARLARVDRIVNMLPGLGWAFTSTDGTGKWLKRAISRGLRIALSQGSVVLSNEDDMRLMLNLGVARERIHIIPGSGIDFEQFCWQPEVATGPAVILLPARLLWDKGVGEFVEAARLLKAKGLDVRCLLAGEPDDQNPAAVSREDIANWVAEGIVEHLGWVRDMPAMYAASHIICLPSYREGLPRSLIEASAVGRAVVTTDVPGCRDVVQDGVNGILVPAKAVEPLAAALERLVRNGEERRAMGEHGRILAHSRYDRSQLLSCYLNLYDSKQPSGSL